MATDNSNSGRRHTGRSTGSLLIAEKVTQDARLLAPTGVLDSSTYTQLRNVVVEAAHEQPRAVIVDVDNLEVSAPSAWSVFSSAHWLVSTWPGIPIRLVSRDRDQRTAIDRSAVTRWVPVHQSVQSALAEIDTAPRARSRARLELPATLCSLRAAREFVARSLAGWGARDLVPAATVVVNVFVENVLQHTFAEPILLLENDGDSFTIAVHDDNAAPAALHEHSTSGGQQISGLAIVTSVSRAWGSAPLSSGKTVWAVIGPENKL